MHGECGVRKKNKNGIQINVEKGNWMLPGRGKEKAEKEERGREREGKGKEKGKKERKTFGLS